MLLGAWQWGDVGESSHLFCCFALLSVPTSGPLHCSPPPDTPPPNKFQLACQGKSDSVGPALGYPYNLLCNPTPVVKGGELWEVKGRWPGSVTLFLCLECQLPDSRGHTSVLRPCPGHWAQLQLILSTPAGMLIKSLCFSRRKGVPATT